MRNYVAFRSNAFNTTEDREIYLKPGHFGDDLAAWLADRLSELGWEVDDEISQEPLGWFITFRREADEFDLGVSCLNPERGVWMAWLEQPAGFFSGLFGRRHREVDPSGPKAVDEVLTDSPEVSAIRWHTRDQFIRGEIDESDEASEAEPAASSTAGYLS